MDVELLSDRRHWRADLKAISRAIRNGWDIDQNKKAEIVRRVMAIIDDPSTDRMLIGAAKTLMTMIEDDNKRLDALELAESRGHVGS